MIASGLCALQFALTGSHDLGLADEGFLWYGVIQTAAGQVPILDFQAYDPGRYYWGAAWSLLFGDGILALRQSSAIFQALGLFCGLCVVRRISANPALLLLFGTVLLLWMFPRHKLFEPSLAMMAVLVAVRLVENPTAGRHFAAGAFVGLAAFFGRNHGVYTALGQLTLIGLLIAKHAGDRPARRLLAWGAGVAIGYSPMWMLMVGVPGFASSLMDSMLVLLEGESNLDRPVVWPWQVLSNPGFDLRRLAKLAVSLGYVLMAVVYPLGLWVALRTRADGLPTRAVLIGSICVGLFYSHHAWDRASPWHLAQSIHPLLLALLALPMSFGWPRRSFGTVASWAGVVAMTASVSLAGLNPMLGPYDLGPNRAELVPIRIRGDTLLLSELRAERLHKLQAAIEARVPSEEPLLILPYRATYYPLLGRVSPVWGLYFTRPDEGQSDMEMIRALEEKQVNWVLMTRDKHYTPGGFPKLRPEVWKYLQREFRRVDAPELPSPNYLMRRVSRSERRPT